VSDDLHELSLRDAATRVRQRAVAAVDLTRAALARIAAVETNLGAFLTLNEVEAIAAAEAIDRRIGAGQDPGPLAGVPIAVKDNICTAGLRTTAGSRILERFVPAFDATVTARLRAAGAVVVGKANCDEFGMGSSTENSALGTTRNPWDSARVPGGSSGGSAVAVAAREAYGALGTDTGGSVRLPSAFCGIVGLKPTYGRVSRFGVIAYASSLDQVGPLARDVADVAVLLEAIAGHDPADSTASPRPVPSYLAALDGKVKGLRLGLPREYFVEGMQPEVESAVRAADLVAFHVPMHAATRLALRVIPRVRRLAPDAVLCAYGLYAAMNDASLRGAGVRHLLSGEYEAELVALARAPRQAEPRLVTSVERLEFRVPDREGLPEGTVKSRINRGRTELARQIRRIRDQLAASVDVKTTRKTGVPG